MLYVLDLVKKKAGSPSYGAEVMNIHLTDFVEKMAQHEIPYFTDLLR